MGVVIANTILTINPIKQINHINAHAAYIKCLNYFLLKNAIIMIAKRTMEAVKIIIAK
jgi:hypothetical protein